MKTSQSLILTGNHVLEGHILYWTGKGWDQQFAHALVSDDAESLEARLREYEACNLVTGCYLIAVARDEYGHWQPVKMRERARLRGPSIDYHNPTSMNAESINVSL
ncbi:MAG: DUF2849 domain-containing protein [Pseudomonadota bacterium]